ncbi:hypothetical protein JAAARDRAFT_121442 [Jaapia argillacea MUCL 33604]|uniref:RlpA-like protein double-psi beta-barrel domain-containing protein n=1 Tax=Jaapia argillacea MUCL 33604 TaxID=933084 RepID=A0A067Q6K0_9AGAM|nr:hypothetical protein JAAARDRAFT_121442 [Jaapia argillacea MUCL 33604]
MSRIALFIFTLLAFIAMAFGMPVPGNSTEDLEKRITHTGRGTWFNTGEGACGGWNVNSDKIVAISHLRWDGGVNCGQWMQITNTANGKTAYGLTRDECMGCGDGDVDMSPSLFEELGNLDTGVLSVSWHFKAKGWSP